jgi:trehalose synthase
MPGNTNGGEDQTGGAPHLVHTGTQPPEAFEEFTGRPVLDQLRALAEPLRGKRVLELNSTSYGGGVSELLRSLVPLLRGLDIDVEWRVIAADASFFQVTKLLHNALQGAAATLNDEERETYLACNNTNATLLDPTYDFVFVHDPQPTAVRHFAAELGRHWVWRCHIDTSVPNKAAWEFLSPFVHEYNAAVFTMSEFVPPDLDLDVVAIIPPAIDPLSPKNLPIPDLLARRIIDWVGLSPDRPIMTQVSRFDRWKDPLGAIEVYRRVRKQIPDLQFALLGSMALDDPEGWDVYHSVQHETRDDPEIHLFTNLTGISNVEINAFQMLSNVVIQKSIREGFGLVVSETLWKGTPVVAGRAGGIPLQIPTQDHHLLVDDVDTAAACVLELLQNPDQAGAYGARGREWVRDRFLLPRLASDELRLMRRLLGIDPVE